MADTDNILVIGANGQIGTELVVELRRRVGDIKVFATDVKDANQVLKDSGHFEKLDVLDREALTGILRKNKIKQVYQLAALLSATSEQKPIAAWRLNMEGLLNILNAALDLNIPKVFWPSSIAAFGPHTPADQTPQYTIMDPNTVYGISKLAGEGWCDYYFQKKGLDVRSIRYPGLISYKTPPGGGTTDYAVEIFHEAKRSNSYTSFLQENTRLPMMYMQDAIRGTIELMEAPADQISVRTSYNFSAIDFTPAELAGSIKNHLPQFTIDYKPDFRQTLADSWPNSIDDSYARNDWGWKHEFDLDKMVADMLQNVSV